MNTRLPRAQLTRQTLIRRATLCLATSGSALAAAGPPWWTTPSLRHAAQAARYASVHAALHLAEHEAAPGDQLRLERYPAAGLSLASPTRGSVPEVDVRRDFGAAGDGVQDDGPAFLALAAAVNAGQVPAGAVAFIPAGVYRVAGNEAVTFHRPVVLRGEGPTSTIIQLAYTAQRSVFLRASGEGMYVMHSNGVYNGRSGGNRYPTAPYAAVQGAAERGDTWVAVDRPELFTAGDHVYLLCDDYGAEVVYQPNNKRSEHFLLKQYLTVRRVEGQQIWLDTPLRHDFAGTAPRLYRWHPLSGFGVEHLAIDDQNTIPDTEEANTFKAVQLDGTMASWVWNVHFRNNTSIPLSVGRSRHAVVCESLFDRARHIGGGGNGYLPELYFADDSLVEYCTSLEGRHALICNWSCWGNVFRYNRVAGTPNTETHGEYSVENLYLRNDARAARMEIGGGGDRVHAHDGPYNELRENYAQEQRVLKAHDRDNRLIDNWHMRPIVDLGAATLSQGNERVPPGWDNFPFATVCGHDHTQTAEIARQATKP